MPRVLTNPTAVAVERSGKPYTPAYKNIDLDSPIAYERVAHQGVRAVQLNGRTISPSAKAAGQRAGNAG